MPTQVHEVIWFEGLGRADVAVVVGKNAALGYMVRHLGQPFHWLCHFAGLLALCRGELIEKTQSQRLCRIIRQAASLWEAGPAIRRAIVRAEWPAETAEAILGA